MTRAQREIYRLGRRGLDRGDSNTAIVHLTRLLSSCPGFADVHYMLGMAYERKGDLPEAARSFERALEINPGYAEAGLALASVYERQGEFERCGDLAESTQRNTPAARGPVDATTQGKLANLHAALGDAYREVGDLREAAEAYRKAIDRCPDFHDIRHRLAVTLRDAGLPDQAIREFHRVRRSMPQFLDAAVQLGLTYFTLGRTPEAVSEWEAVLAEDPAREDARMYLRMVHGNGEIPAESNESPGG